MKKGIPGNSSPTGTLETVFAEKRQTSLGDTTNTTVYVEFQCSALARFLSHADLLRTLVRSCVRAGLTLKYTQGFNPRPRISLPLPKAVGLDSRGDVLCFQLADQSEPVDEDHINWRLSKQLPQGISVLSVTMTPCKHSLQPSSATIAIPLHAARMNEALQNKIKSLMDSTQCVITRAAGKNKTKEIEIRQFVLSLHTTERGIDVTCPITPQGSVRIDEILSVLNIDREDLAGPIQRSHVQWRLN